MVSKKKDEVEEFDPLEGFDVETEVDVESKQELKGEIFKDVDIKDFSDFNSDSPVTKKGKYNFSVEQKFLKSATNLTKVTSSSSKAAFRAVKITMHNNRMKLATFNQSAFVEDIIPLHSCDFKESERVTFIFDQEVLSKISSTFGDVISFNLDAVKSLLVIQSGKTHLELSTYPETEFVRYHFKMDDSSEIKKIDIDTLHGGIKYASLFTMKNDSQLAMSLVEVRDGEIVGGSYSAICIFQTNSLEGFEFKVKFEVISILDKVLHHFNSENTHLFETDTFYILRDENLFFGFEKSNHAFPPTKKFLVGKTAKEIVNVNRSEMLSSLQKLSVVSADRNLAVTCEISGSGVDSEIKLSTKDASGKVSNDILPVQRTGEGDKSDKTQFLLSVSALLKAVSYFETANVHFKIVDKKAIIIVDEQESIKANTILSMLSEESEE